LRVDRKKTNDVSSYSSKNCRSNSLNSSKILNKIDFANKSTYSTSGVDGLLVNRKYNDPLRNFTPPKEKKEVAKENSLEKIFNGKIK